MNKVVPASQFPHLSSMTPPNSSNRAQRSPSGLACMKQMAMANEEADVPGDMPPPLPRSRPGEFQRAALRVVRMHCRRLRCEDGSEAGVRALQQRAPVVPVRAGQSLANRWAIAVL